MTTEFYNNYKRLMFKQSQTIFREHIVSELNMLIERLKIKVKIKSLLSSKEYKEYIKKYLSGEMSYNEILNFL